MADPSNTLPLFPLNTVLFPGEKLRLHIFEKHYQTMIKKCVTNSTPFGVVLIKRGNEVGNTAIPHDIGTSARIDNIETLSDGLMNISTHGENRFAITGNLERIPYPQSTVLYIDKFEEIDHDLCNEIAERFKEYIKLAASGNGEWINKVTLPRYQSKLSYKIGHLLPIPANQKQLLLEIPTESERLQKELDVIKTLKQKTTNMARRNSALTSFSKN